MDRDSGTLLVRARLAARSVVAAIAVASGILLLGPPWLIARMGLQEVVSARRELIGLGCLAATAALLVTQVLPWSIALVTRRLEQWSDFKKGKKRLHDLTRSEKNILKQYLARESRTLVLDGRSSATVALQRTEVITRTGDLEDTLTGMTFTISPWAWNYLRTNRHILETSESSPTRLSDWRDRRRG